VKRFHDDRDHPKIRQLGADDIDQMLGTSAQTSGRDLHEMIGDRMGLPS
jgi:hypothetical protein